MSVRWMVEVKILLLISPLMMRSSPCWIQDLSSVCRSDSKRESGSVVGEPVLRR